MIDGGFDGIAVSDGNGGFTSNLHVELNTTEDRILSRVVEKPKGWGYSIDASVVY